MSTDTTPTSARGFFVSHNGIRVFYPDAATPEEAAEEYANGGEWYLDPGESITLHLLVWEASDVYYECRSAYDVTVTA